MSPIRFAAAAALTLALGGSALAADSGSQAYPATAAQPVPVVAGESLLLPGNGDVSVQTANSLPRGAMEGTVAYTQAQRAARHFAAREQRNRLAAQGLRGLPRG